MSVASSDISGTGWRSTAQRTAAIVSRGIETVLGTAGALILAVLLALVTLSVTLRYVFSTGLTGSDELAVWLNVAMIAVGAPLALHSGLAMRLDLLHRVLPPAGRAAFDVAADTITMLSGLVIGFGSLGIIGMIGGTSPALGLPEWMRFAFFVPSGLLIVAQVVLRQIADGRLALTVASGLLTGLIWFAAPGLYINTGLPPSIITGLIALIGILVAAPLPHAFLLAAWLAISFGSTLPEPALVNNAIGGMSKFLLLAIPFFLLAGTLLTESGIAARLVRFASALVGHWRGGLAQTTLITSMLFSGASGSSIANAAFGTTTFHPELVRRGYSPERAGAIVAATSVLDNVIPPSIAFLILAAATNLSVGRLLVGGVFAGLVMTLFLGIAFRVTAHEKFSAAKAPGAEIRAAAIAAMPAFGLGLIVVLGIRFGIVTTTEAAAVAALYTLGLGLWRRLGAGRIFGAFRQSAAEAAAIGMLIGTAGPFAFMLAVDNISGQIAAAATAFGSGPGMVLLAACIILLIVGLFLDIGAAILLFGPLLLPVVSQAGIDPIAFGVILVVNLMIGGLTPPVGILVFVVSGISRVPAQALFRAGLPYLVALLGALALLCLVAILFPPFF
ncbi:TRAP transporter large permease subunit [Sinirhodobacter populi]|uniref:TRAP transporter large permease subunit n=1 Tax=Paenirhodobacter populi TaxID=2306993 RepID=A0A443K4M8_9RHOB|nr:TRAP transporter large permease subunit [Sinirhodobacter populi]RWR27716.1 TRAP transporter large permease subunit [Sinirhodobacter populi]